MTCDADARARTECWGCLDCTHRVFQGKGCNCFLPMRCGLCQKISVWLGPLRSCLRVPEEDGIGQKDEMCGSRCLEWLQEWSHICQSQGNCRMQASKRDLGSIHGMTPRDESCPGPTRGSSFGQVKAVQSLYLSSCSWL